MSDSIKQFLEFLSIMCILWAIFMRLGNILDAIKKEKGC